MDAAGGGSGGGENGGLSLSRSCKERRQPAENSPARKKGSSQGVFGSPLFLSHYASNPPTPVCGAPGGWFG